MRLFPLRLVPANTKYDFIGKRWIGFAITFVGIALSLGLVATKGLNFGIDFSGGLLMEVRSEREIDLGKMRDLFADGRFGEVSLQEVGDARDILIRVKLEKDQDQTALTQAIKATLEENGFALDYRRIEGVGPTVGQELIHKGALAMGLALTGIMAYLWFRFEWQYGLGGMLALIHDLILMIGFYAFTQYEFGLTSIAAVLTILGYSINDSVVIYDRIRENLRKYKKMPLPDLLNLSMNETLGRTILTVCTTFLSVLALVLLGGEVIRGFSLSILFGLIVGTYSSIYVSAAGLIYLRLRPAAEPTPTAVPAR